MKLVRYFTDEVQITIDTNDRGEAVVVAKFSDPDIKHYTLGTFTLRGSYADPQFSFDYDDRHCEVFAITSKDALVEDLG